ncbi:MAG: VCBS repeat-containing protein, partial [Thermoplasmata archaeon]|nr:VCBS repeat-containing protein [Thermoplasmata archaeon]
MMGSTITDRWTRRTRRAAFRISVLMIVGSMIALPVTVASPSDGDPDGGTLNATRAGGEEWRDDFVSEGKILRSKGTVLSGGTLSVNTSSGEYGSASRDHGAFPPVYITSFRGGASNIIDRFFANATGTGYRDRSRIGCWDTIDIEFVDANLDGYYDLVCANNDGQGIDSGIWWGRPALSRDYATRIDAGRPSSVTSGDFNGDGWPDLAFGTVDPDDDDTAKIMVFLNQGDGVFNHQPDLALPPSLNVESADLDDDGYDDLVAAGWYDDVTNCYFGSPQGLDATADISFTTTVDADSPTEGILVYDLDDDGHLDVVVGIAFNSKVLIYMGDFDGPDNVADHQVSVTGYCYAVGAGDINGD